jgi:hypothetical protein
MIDVFVQAMNAAFREPKQDWEVPESLRTFELDGYYGWRIGSADFEKRIAKLEAKLPVPLPASFRSFFARYAFPAFELGPVVLYGNTVEGTRYELDQMVFANAVLSEVLFAERLIQIGRLINWHPDPVCFDAREPAAGNEYPLVRVDHEEATRNRRAPVVATISPSFATVIAPLL